MVIIARRGESGLRSDGSIDYDFYRACAQDLRRKFLAQASSSAAGHVVRGLTIIAEWIVARGDEPGLEIRHGL